MLRSTIIKINIKKEVEGEIITETSTSKDLDSNKETTTITVMIRIITSSKTIEDKKTIEVVIMIAIEGEIILMDRNIEM